MIMSLAWNFPLKLSSSTIFRGAESSDSAMSPNKLFSCDCNFYTTVLKDKSPVYHVFSKAGCYCGRLYEGEGRKLKRTLSHYCACTKLIDSQTGCWDFKRSTQCYRTFKNLCIILGWVTPLNLLKTTDQCSH